MRALLQRTLCAATLLVTVPALAVDDGTQEAPPADSGEGSVTYSSGGLLLAKADDLRVNSSTTLQFDKPINLTGVIGFRIPTLPSFGLELDFATTVIPGQIMVNQCQTTPGTPGGVLGGGTSGSTSCSSRDGGDYGVNSISVYGVFRSPGKFYGMGKFGYGYLASNVDGQFEKRNDTTYGLGAGYRWNPKKNNGVELYYIKMRENLEYQGLSFSYGFGGRD